MRPSHIWAETYPELQWFSIDKGASCGGSWLEGQLPSKQIAESDVLWVVLAFPVAQERKEEIVARMVGLLLVPSNKSTKNVVKRAPWPCYLDVRPASD